VFDGGVETLRSLGLDVREMAFTRARAATPRERAADLNAAFGNPEIRGVFASIGGDDSIRLLPFLDRDAIAANPKILIGYSDTTTLLCAIRRFGLVTFHGPSVMAGLSQAGALPAAFRSHLEVMVFEPADNRRYEAYDVVVEGYPDWRDPANTGLVNPARPADGPRVLQDGGRVVGELFGGCLEVLDWNRGTSAWPGPTDWAGRLFFVEPSEEKPTPTQVERILRSFGALGVFDEDDGVAGLLVGRTRDMDHDETAAFERTIVAVIGGELGRTDMPILANLPFGHTDPQWILPIGVRAELEVAKRSLRLVEPWLA
jgi:muramoyltetrapeptide carboxypeptidase LdcA involved in peptidoglycan recycling